MYLLLLRKQCTNPSQGSEMPLSVVFRVIPFDYGATTWPRSNMGETRSTQYYVMLPTNTNPGNRKRNPVSKGLHWSSQNDPDCLLCHSQMKWICGKMVTKGYHIRQNSILWVMLHRNTINYNVTNLTWAYPLFNILCLSLQWFIQARWLVLQASRGELCLSRPRQTFTIGVLSSSANMTC